LAKNLKLNIKNAQLAEALKLTQVKKAPKEKEKKKVESAPVVAAPPPAEELAPKIQEEAAPQKEVAAEAHAAPKEEFAEREIEEKEVFEKKVEEQEPQAPRPPMQPHYERRTGGFEQRPHYQQRQGPRPGGFQSRPPGQGYQPRPQGQGYQQRPGFGERRPPGEYRPHQPRPPHGAGAPYNRGPQPGRPYSPRGPMPPRELPSQRPLPPKAPPTSFETRKTGPKEYRDVKPLKKAQERTFDSRDRQGLTDVENEAWRKRRPSHKHKQIIQEEVLRPKELSIRLPITVKDLASAMKLKASQLISKLFMKGVVLTLNDFLDDETTIQLLGHDFDCEIKIDTSEEERIRITDKTIKQEIEETDADLLKIRAPVVAFMGHVDHGKTSLIDSIRKSNRVSTEAGAITQHIGAFRCHTSVGDITVLDTPGHEAFSSMRERGTDVTDIVVLVVAGDEGLKTQTLEAIEQAKSAKVPIVVAINKSDKPSFNADNVYRQLSENDLLPEKWGGSVITINCSALTGAGVSELLEMLALQAEVLELKANPETRARGAVIESEMHKGLGAQATVLVQNGSLRQGDAIVFDQHWGRVKTMHDENGKEIKIAGPSTPVKITGLSGLPEAGSEFIIVKTEKEARELGEARTLGHKNLALQQAKKVGVEGLLQKKAETLQKKILNLILRADVQGSLEALKTSLMKIESKKVELNVISSEVGEISESDIQLAAASKATIVGFHTKIESHAESLIKELKVAIRLHDIIYHAVDDVKEIMIGLLDKIAEESDTGVAEVKATFKASQLGVIAGCQVTQGTIRRNQHVRLLRGGEQIWKGPIASLKKVKEDVREVSKGMECGILLQNFNNVKEGDTIQAFDINYLTQEL
jgi:translation initiation factor IF-2